MKSFCADIGDAYCTSRASRAIVEEFHRKKTGCKLYTRSTVHRIEGLSTEGLYKKIPFFRRFPLYEFRYSQEHAFKSHNPAERIETQKQPQDPVRIWLESTK